MFLYEVTDIFEKAQLKYALIGGYAMALQGLVRATVDIDFVLHLRLADFELAEKLLAQIGLQSRLPLRAQDLIKMRAEYIENRNLVAWSFVDYKNPSRQVDILITKDLRDLKVENISVSGRKIPTATLSELLKMKTESGRPQDLVDIANKKEAPRLPQPISPEEAVRFLDDIRKMSHDIDEATVPISLRVPANILRTLKLKARAEGRKYQSLMIEYLRQGLREK